ncbi:hypothetical protein J1N35_034273 [Gossypium stocksii]|uniref:Uncharacterized protein n=1 Tax=Gossypium stocksii TaxID=47602 RepID=A0A9D3URP1_9ROSI|nr:hypothetical protein J1N35_034273 [Gossypium stocksii]
MPKSRFGLSSAPISTGHCRITAIFQYVFLDSHTVRIFERSSAAQQLENAETDGLKWDNGGEVTVRDGGGDGEGDCSGGWESLCERVNGGESAERGWSGCLKEWESGSVAGGVAELGCWMMGGAGGGRPAVM